MGENLSETTPKDFFISYSSADRLWAEWIVWHLEQAGYSVELPDFGLQSGYNFALNIDNITREAKRIIAILSPNYIRSLYSQLDWALTIKRDARAKQGLVLLVHVEECKHILKDILGSVKFINVVAQDSSKVQEILLTSIRHEYSKPGFPSFSPEINKEMRDTLKKDLHFWQEREISSGDPIFSPVWNVPYQRNPFFTNRDEVLDRLRHNFEADSNAVLNQPQALTGIGGVGKTQIALEYAYRYRDEYQVVLWIQANSFEAMVADFVASAQLLNLPEGDAQDQSLAAAAVKHWLKDHTGWLLILDNVDDLV